MANFKDTKKEGMLTELAAQYIAREAGRSTLITPTRAHIASDRKHATIFVSVYPETEGAHAITFLMRHKDLFRDFLKSRARFPILPYITFEIDYGELNRQRMDELSAQAGIIPSADADPDENA
jgi:ribosome-binding factor A